MNQDKVYKLCDLCAGTGAFSHVFTKNHNVQCVYANDFCKESEEIFNLNHNIKLTNNDINKINPKNIPKHDILTCGFPCQPFSIAGERKGFDDKRSNVFLKIIKIMKHHKPSIVILENVKNLKSHDKGRTFKIIKEKLEELDYHIKYKILNTCEITKVPQNRERVYIMCFKDKKLCDAFDFNFKKIKNKPIKYFLEKNIPTKYYYTSKLKVYDKIKESITEHIDENAIYQYRRYYVRKNQNSRCMTLTANCGTGGHNVPLLLDDNGIRKLTPRECFNLQGFPSNYKLPELSDSRLYKLAGNAISPPVVALIANKLFNIINQDDH